MPSTGQKGANATLNRHDIEGPQGPQTAGAQDNTDDHGVRNAVAAYSLSLRRDRLSRSGDGVDVSTLDHDGRVRAALSIQYIIWLRRERDAIFPSVEFADPGWDILLDAVLARLQAIPLSVSALCVGARVPPTTALRWIGKLIEGGMLERQDDPQDARRSHIQPTERAVASILHVVQLSQRAARQRSQINHIDSQGNIDTTFGGELSDGAQRLGQASERKRLSV